MRFVYICSALLVALTHFEGASASVAEATLQTHGRDRDLAYAKALRLAGSNDSTWNTLRFLIAVIRSSLVLTPENGALFNQAVEDLDKAERRAEKDARKANVSPLNQMPGFRRGMKKAVIPHDVRSGIKATLVQILKNSELRVPSSRAPQQKAVVVDPESRPPMRPEMDKSDLPILNGRFIKDLDYVAIFDQRIFLIDQEIRRMANLGNTEELLRLMEIRTEMAVKRRDITSF
jgi:hypothetical protein